LPIFDETGQSRSITEGPRALRLFTDRHHLIRVFVRALHEEEDLGKILYFRGGGGNGKSLLIRFLRTYVCKRFHDWEEFCQRQDADLVDRLQRERSYDQLPVASLDFHAPAREFEQPMVGYDALLMLRRQLGTFRTRGFSNLHFPIYDFAALWYLHQTGRLTAERLSSLFPREESNLILELAELLIGLPVAGVGQAVLELFNKHLGEWWTLFKARRGINSTLLQDIQAMDPEGELVLEMPSLFALDLNATLRADHAPPRIVLLFDGHDAFATTSGAYAPEGDRDRWLRNLLGTLDLEAGVVPVVTSRRELRWEEKAQDYIPIDYLGTFTVDHFSDIDAHSYLKKAEVYDTALRARLCDYARVAPYEVHPLYVGLGADVVLQAARRGRHLTAEDFPEEPDVEKKPKILVERLLMEATEDVEYAVRSLAAARAFDRSLFEMLGNWRRSRYSATDAAFDTLTRFSFVWEAETREEGWYSIHALLRRIFRQRGDERLREADEALFALYRERFEQGHRLALAESVYHAYQLEAEVGLETWLMAFDIGINERRYNLCEALQAVLAEFRQPEDPWWRARVAEREGKYFAVRFRSSEADEALQASAAAYEEALNDASEPWDVYDRQANVLAARARLMTSLSRYIEAEEILRASVAASDEAINLAPSLWEAYDSKGMALAELGKVLAELFRHD
jgi:hypothetical protein